MAGALALQSADLTFDTDYFRSSKLLKAASVIADSLDGFSEGFGDSLSELAEAVPALWNLTKNGAIVLWEDPEQAWQSVLEFAYQLDDVADAVMIAVSKDIDTLKEGTAYERSKIIGYYSLDLITALASGGSMAVAKGITKAGSLAKFMENAGHVVTITKNAPLGVIRKAAVPTQKLIKSVKTLKLRSSFEVSIVSKISRQIMMSDKSTYNAINKMADSARAVRPKQGNRFVRNLPELTGSYKKAFEGHIFKGVYEPGEILFQAQSDGVTRIGNWFTPVKPLNAQHADEMLNIRYWGNDGEQLKAYVVKERISGYAGKIEGGEGHQFFVPKDVPLDDVFDVVDFE